MEHIIISKAVEVIEFAHPFRRTAYICECACELTVVLTPHLDYKVGEQLIERIRCGRFEGYIDCECHD